MEEVKVALVESEKDGSKILIVAQEETNGLLGLVNCLTKEPGGVNLRFEQYSVVNCCIFC